MPQRKAVFLDRDGTLVKAIVNRPGFEKKVTAPFSMHELEFAPDLDKALDRIRSLGHLLIIITNQPDVAYGYVTEDEWRKIFDAILRRVRPDDYLFCRHRRQDNCPMRKPSPMMIQAAACKWDVDLKKSFMIGDTENDTEAGKAAGCKTILLDREYNVSIPADFLAVDLSGAADLIEWHSKHPQ